MSQLVDTAGPAGQLGSELGAGGALCQPDAEEPGALEEEADRKGESPSPQTQQRRS